VRFRYLDNYLNYIMLVNFVKWKNKKSAILKRKNCAFVFAGGFAEGGQALLSD